MNVSHLQAPQHMEAEANLNSQLTSQCHTNLKAAENVNNNGAAFIFNVDIEKGDANQILNPAEQSIATSDDCLRAFPKEICLQIGGKFTQLFTNHGLELLKFASIDKHDTTANNKSRKYKRSASFSSRRVVLLFSVLSSMGTIILIYLTLRAKHINDGFW